MMNLDQSSFLHILKLSKLQDSVFFNFLKFYKQILFSYIQFVTRGNLFNPFQWVFFATFILICSYFISGFIAGNK